MGVDISVASPKGYTIPPKMREIITSSATGVSSPGKLFEMNVPEEAIKDADLIVILGPAWGKRPNQRRD